MKSIRFSCSNRNPFRRINHLRHACEVLCLENSAKRTKAKEARRLTGGAFIHGRVVLDPESLAEKLRRIKQMRGCTAGLPAGTDMLLEDWRLERERELTEEGW
jgi:hypothetical protein